MFVFSKLGSAFLKSSHTPPLLLIFPERVALVCSGLASYRVQKRGGESAKAVCMGLSRHEQQVGVNRERGAGEAEQEGMCVCRDSHAQRVRDAGPEGYLFLGLSSVCGLLPPPSGLGSAPSSRETFLALPHQVDSATS